MNYLQSLREGLRRALQRSPEVCLLGEDIVDPYGGAFKATQGLSTEFPDRVWSTPISEAGITGVAIGLALRGLRPVVEIMFGDFLTLCTDQLVNSATKFPLMYRHGVQVPMVVRTPMGGGRGYGPTHSQSLEKLFLGVPGLRVVSPSLAHDPGALVEHAVLSGTSPTRTALRAFLPRMPAGAVLAFDELNQRAWPGETLAVLEEVGLRKLRIRRFPFTPALSYAVLDS